MNLNDKALQAKIIQKAHNRALRSTCSDCCESPCICHLTNAELDPFSQYDNYQELDFRDPNQPEPLTEDDK